MTSKLGKQEEFLRKEKILHLRARIRNDVILRDRVVDAIFNVLDLSDIKDKELISHITIAIDDEINDTQAHVIL